MKTKVLLALALLGGFAASAQALTIVGSKHDLSITTAGSVRVTGSNQTCVFCHTPHNAKVNKLLWNRANTLSGASFNIYTSYNRTVMRDGLISRTALSNGSTSLLCLSCHALATSNALATNTVPSVALVADAPATARWAATTGNMTDLSSDHPVGINYLAARALDTSALVAATGTTHVGAATKVRLFSNSVTGAGSMECASCHDVHDNTQGKFLAISNTASALCITCHVK